MTREVLSENPLILVEKKTPIPRGLVIARTRGQGIVAENLFAILVQEVSEEQVEVNIAKITGHNLSTITSPQRQTLKLDKVYGLPDTAYDLLAFFDYQTSGDNIKKVKFVLSFPGVLLLRDELIETEQGRILQAESFPPKID